MKQKGTYAVCVLMLACLIGSAFYAPSLVMQWNDYQLLQDYQFQKRNGIDYEAINTGYITDHKERLNAFAKGISEGRQYYIASTGEEPKLLEELLVNAIEQEISYLLQSAGVLWLVEGIYDRDNITAWDHYVIYDKEGVDFLCWYLELTTEEEIVRVLIDAVDYTIYYVECYHQGIFNLFSNHYNKDTMDWSWITYDVMNLKYLYGDDTFLMFLEWEKTKAVSGKNQENIVKQEETDGMSTGEKHEVLSRMQLADGSLQLSVSILDRVKDYYGIGIGISELKELLPAERKGECLVSFG